MEKNKRIIKILKFLLQVLVAAVTSWGTATGMSSPHEDPVQAPLYLDDDYPIVFG